MERYKAVEESIVTAFRETLWEKFTAGVEQYALIQDGDKIAVCVSGGKDSMLTAKCVQMLQRLGKPRFDAVFLVMNPGYNDINRQTVTDNAQLLHLPIHMFETRIFDIVAGTDRSPCYLCAKMRRGYLYGKARELGCNKIALGHHFDDVVETTLMSMLYSGEVKTMMPKLHSANFGGMELIRPIYAVKEADILRWKSANDLTFIQCACRFTENCAFGGSGGGTKREEMKTLIKRLRRLDSRIDENIFESTHNVALDSVIGYRDRAGRHCFLDAY
ncbi:MAG: tRNA 2-thiocytidine biosynthesis protein TtcA [Clostridiales bacterium]|jgi:tRNA(Ile)-lysidine synthase TilS/MesJ|nr:tRNA 2-thiocytidine biosynthesis protein TtcA [Clostridiales bacterium]